MNGKYLRVSFLLILVTCSVASASWGQGSDNAERVLFNAKVFTGVRDNPYADAVAIKGDKIVAVGNCAKIVADATNKKKNNPPTHFRISGLSLDRATKLMRFSSPFDKRS